MNLTQILDHACVASLPANGVEPIGTVVVQADKPAEPAHADVVALCDVLADNAAREAGVLARLVAVVMAAPQPQAMADALAQQFKMELTARGYKGVAVRVSELRKCFEAAIGQAWQPEPDEGLQAAVKRARKAIKGPQSADNAEDQMLKAIRSFRKALEANRPDVLNSFDDWIIRKGL